MIKQTTHPLLTLSVFIQSLTHLHEQYGDVPVSMFDSKSGAFGSFSSFVLPRPSQTDGDFMGLICEGDVKTFMQLASAPETAPQ